MVGASGGGASGGGGGSKKGGDSISKEDMDVPKVKPKSLSKKRKK